MNKKYTKRELELFKIKQTFAKVLPIPDNEMTDSGKWLYNFHMTENFCSYIKSEIDNGRMKINGDILVAYDWFGVWNTWTTPEGNDYEEFEPNGGREKCFEMCGSYEYTDFFNMIYEDENSDWRNV